MNAFPAAGLLLYYWNKSHDSITNFYLFLMNSS